MLTQENILEIVKRLGEMRPVEPELRHELRAIVKFIIDHSNDPDWTPVEDPDASSDEEGSCDEEEHIIDRSDPNFISIK